MPGKRMENGDRARQLLAQEAARLIVDHGIRDYRVAKMKAAERLGMNTLGVLPRNAEIELAIGEHLQLFGGDAHSDFLRSMREAALSAMRLLELFTPRLVGPVLAGTADENSSVNLHVFADSPEAVAIRLGDLNYRYRAYERRLKISRGKGAVPNTYAGFQFGHQHEVIEATVFPFDGIRQSPISPIDGKPMQRADVKAVEALIR
jgi:hypothetical protein